MLLVISKCEEINPLLLCNLINLFKLNGAYIIPELFPVEEAMLFMLDHNVPSPPTAPSLSGTSRIIPLSHYVIDGTLRSYALLQYLSGQLATTSVASNMNATCFILS